MKYRKSQAALEFLTTYGWAFLTIMITISALYYFGVFNFSKYLPQKCTFTSQFPCIDFSMIDAPAAQVDIRFKLLNDIGETVHVVSLSVTNEAKNPLTCDTISPTDFNWNDDEEIGFEFSDCHDGVFIKGERTEAKITLTYYAVDTPSQPTHQVRGRLIGIVR